MYTNKRAYSLDFHLDSHEDSCLCGVYFGMTSVLLHNRVYKHLGHFSRSHHDFRSDNCEKLRQWAKLYITSTKFSTFIILRQANGRNPSVSLQATKLATNRTYICKLMQNRRLQTHLQCKPIKSRFCVRPSI